MRSYFLLSIIILFSVSSFSQTPSKEEQIVKLMDITGTKKILDQMFTRMNEMYKNNYPDMDPSIWDSFFSKISSAELINRIVPVYGKHFTEDDIRGMIVFYESPLGRKTIEKLPLIMQESMRIGELFGKEIAEQVKKELLDK